MTRIIQMLASVLILSTVLGCRATELAYDQDHIRSAVMGLHTDQLMDNLIRYRIGLPILQLDYQHMTGTVTDTASGTLAGSQTVAGTKSLTGPTTALAFSRVLTNVFNWTTMGQKVNQLTVTAEPVTTAPDVYQAYETYMRAPSHLMEDYNPPDPDSVIPTLIRSFATCGGSSCQHWRHHPVKYYWVPVGAKQEFLELAIHAMGVRGLPVPGSPDFDVAIVRLETPVKPQPERRPNTWRINFWIDQALPFDQGYMIVDINGVHLANASLLPVDAIDMDDPPAKTSAGERRTRRFVLEVTLNDTFKAYGIDNISKITSALAPKTAQPGPPPAGGAPAGAASQGGQSSSGTRVRIHLDHHWPGMYSTENPAVGDIQNLLRLQYLSGLRNPSATP